tara:strand:- start:13028 stop:13387 length:360 start_codon:yes stop_codon:yes gene_type:complete
MDINIREIWDAITALTGHAPSVSTVPADPDTGFEAWLVEARCNIVTGDDTEPLSATGASIEDAVEEIWVKIREMGPSAHLACGNRSLRYGGGMVGFVPVRVARKKKTTRKKKATSEKSE